MIINEQIAELRKKKGVTQEELANAVGVTNQAVSKWESAQCCPDIQLLPLLAGYFGVSIDDLMGYVPPQQTVSIPPEADERLEEAIRIAAELGRVSTSVLQRRMQVGYGRAGRLLAAMEKMGVIERENTAFSFYRYTP